MHGAGRGAEEMDRADSMDEEGIGELGRQTEMQALRHAARKYSGSARESMRGSCARGVGTSSTVQEAIEDGSGTEGARRTAGAMRSKGARGKWEISRGEMLKEGARGTRSGFWSGVRAAQAHKEWGM